MANELGKPVAPSQECNPCRLSAVRGHCGRPDNTVPYQYGDVSGDSLAEFTAAWEAAGGKTWITGLDGTVPDVPDQGDVVECHWYCPALDGEDFLIDGVVQDTVISKPNPRNGEAAFDAICPPLKAPLFATKRHPQFSVSCWQQIFYEAGVDNSYTSFRDTGATITAVFDDGCPDATFEIPDGTGGWTAQINAISAGIQSILPDSLQNSSFCTIPNTDPPKACANLPTPVIFLPDMKWRYAGFRICPGDKAPVKFIYNSDQRKEVVLDYNIKATKIRYFDRCYDCVTGEVSWKDCATGKDYDGDLVNGKPPCAIPCTQNFPGLPNAPICQSGILPGCVFDADGEQQVGGVTELYKFCEGDDQPQIQLLINYGQDTQSEVELQEGWYFGDCATGAPIEPEPDEPVCPVIGVAHHCVLIAAGEPVERKTGYQVSDFDSGDLEIGDPASCTFNISVDDPNPSFVITPIPGYTFVDNGNGNFTANFNWDGSSNPQQPLEATITLSTGQTHVLTGPDFTLCSGGGDSLSAMYSGAQTKQHIKELCYEGKPSKWQDSQGNQLEYDNLEFCPEDEPVVETPILEKSFDEE